MQDQPTDNAQRVMDLANFEARRMKCDYVGTEHILLAMLYMHSCRGAWILKRFNVALNKVRLRIEQIGEWGQWGLDKPPSNKLPPAPTVKRVVEHAIDEARKLLHNRVGSEHLLLGILREEDGVAAVVLREFGLGLTDVRHFLGSPPEPPPVQPGEEDLLPSLPEEMRRQVHELDDQIVLLTIQKKEAVRTWDFEKAADLRYRIDLLRKQRQDLIGGQDRK